ncbi:DUF6638 family protein [Spongiimicrobium salis]|uniref:DUF6638 family protein n=1 Tax=Spongiimicrobium salis TaxID=1667022 RepID=UPI00374DD4FC
MEKLRAAGLFGGAMVPLSGSLIKRYNECLAVLGVTPTKLKKIEIDGLGWSPEVAEEKEDNFYLNIGEANTNAIIVSPAQKGKPVHMPSHSFDRDLMYAVFAAYERQIRDITKDAALVLHLDQKIDTFFEVFDLLRYEEITVSFEVLNGLDKKQREQEDLIEQFYEGNNFIDRELHQKIVDSAKAYGDLRHRKLYLEPIKVKASSFYTTAFGGVFVLRDFIKDILIFESEEVYKNAIGDTDHEVLLFHIGHDELLTTLVDHIIIEDNMKKAIKTPRYERIKRHLFSEHVQEREHSFQEILDSHFLFKKYLNKLNVDVQKKISGVELYYQRLIVNRNLKKEGYVDPIYAKALHAPHSSLEEEHAALIWKLLVKIAPKDPVHLYWYDKAAFYKAYKSWEPSYQEWVITRIQENNKKYSK